MQSTRTTFGLCRGNQAKRSQFVNGHKKSQQTKSWSIWSSFKRSRTRGVAPALWSHRSPKLAKSKVSSAKRWCRTSSKVLFFKHRASTARARTVKANSKVWLHYSVSPMLRIHMEAERPHQRLKAKSALKAEKVLASVPFDLKLTQTSPKRWTLLKSLSSACWGSKCLHLRAKWRRRRACFKRWHRHCFCRLSKKKSDSWLHRIHKTLLLQMKAPNNLKVA